MLTQLETMVTEYATLAAEIKRKTASLAAVLGNKEDVQHPAHMAFYESVQAWTEAFAKTNPDQKTLIRALEILLLAAARYENKAACWYLIAIQAHGKILIPLLEETGREQLEAAYRSAYPVNRHLPLQKEIYKMLGGKRKYRFPFCNSF